MGGKILAQTENPVTVFNSPNISIWNNIEEIKQILKSSKNQIIYVTGWNRDRATKHQFKLSLIVLN